MKKFVLHIALAFTPFLVFSETYTTLSDGHWTNTTGVWSKDGVNPCGCTPGTEVAGETIIIRHHIIQDVSLNFTGGCAIAVYDGASLETGDYATILTESKMESFGNLSFRKLTIGAGAKLEMRPHTTLKLVSGLLLENLLYLDKAYLFVPDGSIKVNRKGSLQMVASSTIYLDQGGIYNEGYIGICSTCCVQFTGDMYNAVNGKVDGEGAVLALDGGIQNEESWSPDLSWCAAGLDFGMPTPENCERAAQNCSDNALPVEQAASRTTAEMEHDDPGMMAVHIFPNPNKGQFTLKLGEDLMGTNIRIYDLQGNEVYSTSGVFKRNVELNPTLEPGIYQLILNTDGKMRSIKFVVL